MDANEQLEVTPEMSPENSQTGKMLKYYGHLKVNIMILQCFAQLLMMVVTGLHFFQCYNFINSASV